MVSGLVSAHKILLLIVVRVSANEATAGNNVLTMDVPTLSFDQLSTPTGATLALYAMTGLGAVALTGVPDYESARRAALEPLPSCLTAAHAAGELAASAAIMMPDGINRLSLGVASTRGLAPPLPSAGGCGPAAERLRWAVDSASLALFRSLDAAIAAAGSEGAAPPPLMDVAGGGAYRTLAALAHAGEHLEHLHAYLPSASHPHPYENPLYSERPTDETPPGRGSNVTAAAKQSAPMPPTMALHVDNGLFIAMTPGLMVGMNDGSTDIEAGARGGAEVGAQAGANAGGSGLFLSLPHGEVVQARLPGGDEVSPGRG